MKWLLLAGALAVLGYHLSWHLEATELFAIGSHYQVRSGFALPPDREHFANMSEEGFRLSRLIEQQEGAWTLATYFALCGVMTLAFPSTVRVAGAEPIRPPVRWYVTRTGIAVCWAAWVVCLRVFSFPVHRKAVQEQANGYAAGMMGEFARAAQCDDESRWSYALWYGLEGAGVLFSLGLAVWAVWPSRLDRWYATETPQVTGQAAADTPRPN
jgi:hypothetical protein